MALTKVKHRMVEDIPFLVAEDFGAIDDGVVDCKPAFDSLFNQVVATGVRKVLLGAGVYRFASKPISIADKIELLGCGMSSTVLLRDYAEAGTTTGLIDLQYPGSVLRGFAIKASAGSSGGSAISAIASTLLGKASAHVFEDLWLTTDAADKWANPLYIDGSLMVTGAQGARDLSFRNVHVFGCSDTSVTLKSVVGCSWKGGGLYSAGGTGVRSGGLLIDGIASNESFYLDFDTTIVNGKVTFNRDFYCDVRARVIAGAVENNGTVIGCGVEANFIGGAVQTNWTASYKTVAGVTTTYP